MYVCICGCLSVRLFVSCRQKDNTGAQDRNIGLITLYANGFIIGAQDNEFRDIKDPKNKKFFDALRQG